MDNVIQVYRHYLATLSFRLNSVLNDAPDGFGEFEAGADVRTPLSILRHMSVLMGFAEHVIISTEMKSLPKACWQDEVERFGGSLRKLDKILQELDPIEQESLLTALQGPMADAMTHVGQLATLRRLAGAPIEGVSFVKADIRAGNL